MSRYYRISAPSRFGVRTRHCEHLRKAQAAAVDMYRKARGANILPPEDLEIRIEFQRLIASGPSAAEWATWAVYREPRGFAETQE
ncbi:MAG: hypothetical protein IT514_15495 [Burkholderiales bacterium]|nr:hypothetical protein [Burkholderiales bacterium]